MKNLFKNPLLLNFLPFIVLIIIIQVFFYKVVFLEQNFYWRDLLSHSYPAKKIFVDSILSGSFPLWNPYISLGIPYLADLSNQALYFSNLIFLLFPANIAINLTVLLHYLLCSIFTYLFAKNITKDTFIAIFAALAFTLSGYCLSVSCNLEYLSPIAWLPAVFWAYYKAVETDKSIYLLLTGLFVSMLIFAGDPMAFYYLSGFLLLRCLFEVRDKKTFKKHCCFFLIAIILSVVLSAVQLIPSIELTAFSIRSGGLDFREATTWSFNPMRLIEFLLPFYYGHNLPYPTYWGVFLQKHFFNIPWAEGVYVGTIPLILALCSLYYSRTKEKIFWISVVVISLIIAFGSYTPVYKLLFNTLPLLSSFRYPEKMILFTSFALCILAALSLKDLINNKPVILKRTEYFIIIFVVVTAFAVFMDFASLLPLNKMRLSGEVTANFINGNFHFRIIYFVATFSIFWGSWYLFSQKQYDSRYFLSLIILITFIDLFYINSNTFITSRINFYNYRAKVEQYIKKEWKQAYAPRIFCSQYLSTFLTAENQEKNKEAFLKNFYDIFNSYWLENLIPNRSIIYNFGIVDTVSSLKIKAVSELEKTYFIKDKGQFLKNLNIDYILASPFDIKDYQGVTDPVLFTQFNTLLKSNQLTPRAFVVYNALFYPDNETIRYLLLQPSFDINNAILLNGPKKQLFMQADVNNDLKIDAYKCNKVIISVNTRNEGYLVLLDANYPGWKVYVDNKESQLLTANYIYRAVKLPSGKHTITFIFDPLPVKIGVIISLLGLIAGIIAVIKFKTLSRMRNESI